MGKFARLKALSTAALVASISLTVMTVQADDGAIEEIVVTARQQAETLQDVPVTIAAFNEEALDRYGVANLTDASRMVPNFQVFEGQSGNGSNIILRGIGSSSISAAFDQAVAINIDGVVVNIGRFIHNAYMDMSQLEVLKGPQSLYFGKSATAGVMSVTTQNPGDELEAEVTLGVETEHQGQMYEAIFSTPVTDTFGVRFVVGGQKRDEMRLNLWPDVANEWRGDKSKNARATFVWTPTDRLSFNLKYAISEFENDGPVGSQEEICPEGSVQPTAILGNAVILPGVDDCKLNANTSINDVLPNLRGGLPYGGESGVPFLNQDTQFVSLRADWDLSESLVLTSVTGFADLDHVDLDIYDGSTGVFGGLHRNTYRSLSEEIRIASRFDGAFNFMAGLYFQDVEQVFEAYQYAANFGMLAPDPVTGNQYDYNKNHYTDTKTQSFFVAGYWDLSERLELTAGGRYTKDEKDGYITIPYVHAFGAGVFSAPALIPDMQKDANNFSPEVAANYYLNDDISVFVAYKEGFKAGGIDTSALPTAALNTENPDFPGFLFFDEETSKGFEVGMKANLLDDTMRLNATVYNFAYDDLQVQLFDSAAIQYSTFNASELTSRGAEFDLLWYPGMEGLEVRATGAWTDTEYTKTFINATGQDLKGLPAALSADFAGSFGASLDRGLSSGWRVTVSADARMNDGYSLTATLNPFEQRSFVLLDASVILYSEDEKYSLALIGRNLGDEIIARGAGARPGACVNYNPEAEPAGRCKAAPLENEQDQGVTTSLGREVLVRFKMKI